MIDKLTESPYELLVARTQAELDKYGNFSMWSFRDIGIGQIIGEHWQTPDSDLGTCVVVASSTRAEWLARKREFGVDIKFEPDDRAEFWLAVAE